MWICQRHPSPTTLVSYVECRRDAPSRGLDLDRDLWERKHILTGWGILDRHRPGLLCLTRAPDSVLRHSVSL